MSRDKLLGIHEYKVLCALERNINWKLWVAGLRVRVLLYFGVAA